MNNSKNELHEHAQEAPAAGVEDKPKRKKRKKKRYTETRCWSCGRALPHRGCEWADSFTPVDGWTAKSTVIKCNGRPTTKSFLVYKCPKYAKCRDAGRIDDISEADEVAEIVNSFFEKF